jgi:DNA-binding transcriptional LysR family regulator
MKTHDPFRGVAIFMQVVDSGSFTLAAERLDMSKSGISKSISRLELALGMRLFHRTTRHLNLTDEGNLFHEACQRAVAELMDVRTSLTAPQRRMVGRLRISLPVLFGKRWALPILLELAKEHPDLALEINLTDRVVDLVEEAVDLAIRVGPLPDSATLVAKPLGIQRAVLCAHPAYLAAHGLPQSIDDLQRHSCITFGSGASSRQWYLPDARGRSQPLSIRGRLGLNDSEAIRDAALSGLGIALLADWLAIEHLQSGALVRVLPDLQLKGFPVHAVWQKNQHLSPKVRCVVDLLASRFLPKAPWDVTTSCIASPIVAGHLHQRSQ